MAKLLLALAVALAIISHSPAKGAVPPPQPNPTQEFLDAHNKARAEVGVEPLKWSDVLSKATSLLVRYQRDKMGCNFADLTSSNYTGNQMRARGQGVTPRAAVEAWLEEKKYYNYANNSCAAGHNKCWVYALVVWRKSVELGCSQARCVKEDGVLTICFYNPPPNVGEERPY